MTPRLSRNEGFLQSYKVRGRRRSSDYGYLHRTDQEFRVHVIYCHVIIIEWRYNHFSYAHAILSIVAIPGINGPGMAQLWP